MSYLDECLQQIISKLVVELSHSHKLQAFRNSFEKRKIYDQREKSYIQNEKIKKELGAEYDSEESDADDDLEEFGSLTKYQMKCFLKDNLIKNKYDETKLSYIEPPTPEEHSEREFPHSHHQNFDEATALGKNDHLKVIAEKKPINILGKKNLEALDFVIEELQKLVGK